MTTLFEGKHVGEFILYEGEGFFSRDQVIVSSTAPAMVSGTVVAKSTALNEWVPYVNGAADGVGTAGGILYNHVKDATVDQKAVVIVRHAEVSAVELTGLDADARTELLALGIVCR